MSAAVPCLRTVREVQAALAGVRASGATVGLVPTMGALHEGHLSLIRAAHARGDFVVVSVFVNPTQFGPNEDFEVYPRDLERDQEVCAAAGADLIFSPSIEEMYPPGYCTWVEVEGSLTSGLCGRSRPGHFRGVCTVVTKLFNICDPDRAYFGEKDAQQLVVVRRMARDLNMRVEIVSCPTVREEDGLALSSRNSRLTPAERAQAPVVYRALSAAAGLVQRGEREAASLEAAVRTTLAEASLATVDYVEIVSADDLAPVTRLAGECLLAVAVRFGEVRLIDSLKVSAPEAPAAGAVAGAPAA